MVSGRLVLGGASLRWAALLLGLAGCGRSAEPRQVHYTGSDYAFQGPDTLPAGPTEFRFQNDGSLIHELDLLLLRPGVTGAEAFAAEQTGAPVDSIYEADGLLYVQSGRVVEMGLVADLLPGRVYVLMCTLDAGPTGRRHVNLGMFKTLTIR